MYTGLTIKYPLFLSDLNEPWIFSRLILNYQISRKFVHWEPSCFTRTDRQTWRSRQSHLAVLRMRQNRRKPQTVLCPILAPNGAPTKYKPKPLWLRHSAFFSVAISPMVFFPHAWLYQFWAPQNVDTRVWILSCCNVSENLVILWQHCCIRVMF
jgi:hypothetical protein